MEKKVQSILQSAQVKDYVQTDLIHLWNGQDDIFCQVHRHEISEPENKHGIDFTLAIELNGEIHTRKFGMTTSPRCFKEDIARHPHIRQFYFTPTMDDNRIIQPVLALFKDVIN